jgi:hypothetical protein
VSAAELSFAWGDGVLTFDPAGALVSLVRPAQPRLGYLTGLALPALTHDGVPVRWDPPVLAADRDELEIIRVSGPLVARLRHSFVGGWGVRLALANSGNASVVLDAVELPLCVGTGCVGWGFAAGAEAEYSVHPGDGSGPLLGGRLRLGAVDFVGPSGMALGQLELAPGGRYIVQWQWEWYASPRAFAARRPPSLPVRTSYLLGESAYVAAGEDVAVTASTGLEVSRSGGRTTLDAEASGSFLLELRSARGVTRLGLEWVGSAEDLLAKAAEGVLARAPSSTGVVRLAGAAEALVVQHVLQQGRVADANTAEEALDLYAARLLADPSPEVLDAAVLVAEFGRTGDRDALEAAERVVLAVRHPAPGLGIAVMRLGLALTMAGSSSTAVLSHAENVAGALPPPVGRPVAEQAAALELLAVIRDRRTTKGRVVGHRPDLTGRAAAVGPHLGAGLPGQPIAPLPLAVHSHLLATLLLLPEDSDAPLVRQWGCPASVLAAHALPRLLAQLATGEVTEAHAWLTLGGPTP